MLSNCLTASRATGRNIAKVTSAAIEAGAARDKKIMASVQHLQSTTSRRPTTSTRRRRTPTIYKVDLQAATVQERSTICKRRRAATSFKRRRDATVRARRSQAAARRGDAEARRSASGGRAIARTIYKRPRERNLQAAARDAKPTICKRRQFAATYAERDLDLQAGSTTSARLDDLQGRAATS